MEIKVAWQHLLCTLLVTINLGDCSCLHREFHSFFLTAASAVISWYPGRTAGTPAINAQMLMSVVKDGIVFSCAPPPRPPMPCKAYPDHG